MVVVDQEITRVDRGRFQRAWGLIIVRPNHAE